MVLLSGKYAAAATAAERAPCTAGAEVLIALDDGRDRVLQTLGILLDSLSWSRERFQPGLAWLGVATGAIGAVAQVLPPVSGWAYVPCGIAFVLWTLGEPALRNRQLEAAEAIDGRGRAISGRPQMVEVRAPRLAR